jgi:plasmid stability protein
MRTTLNLPDALFAAAKQRALEEGRTVTSLMEEALRARLSTDEADGGPVALPTWAGGSTEGYLVDLSDRDALWSVLDERS